MTALAARLRRLIAATGPIPIQHWMAEANAHYYAAGDPLGAAGDFVTAPEVSQMFGEMVGLWLADLWRRAGSPPVHYVELGPGRGTLAQDALRVMRRFGLDPQLHFVEGSPALRAVQAAAFPDARWHEDLADVPEDAPLLLVANEFLDALPVRQIVRTAAGWRERMVGIEGGRFLPVAGDRPMDAAVPPRWRAAGEGTILETCPAAAAVIGEIALRLATQGGAALVIDYGRVEPNAGSTLQAVRAHRRVDPFTDPGEADLTALVDFAAAAEVAGAAWRGTMDQGAFLTAMGIDARAEALAGATPARAAEIEAACHRLTASDAMGTLFQVMALAGPSWPEAAAFPSRA
jgi:NADH dehydrogenase [ubiquinone] 1 alpha subcomplex assembly factor 7